MPKYALKIEYHGAPFSGWQRQNNRPSVQGAVEKAISKIDRTSPLIAAAGRTDAGVHALAQVAHCVLDRDWDPFRLSEALNFHLKPHPIAIVDAVRAPDDFHARYSALERQYLFRLVSRRAPVTHDRGLVWHIKHPLDLDAMRTGAAYLIGKHDFTTFRSTECQAKSPVKTLDQLDIAEIQRPQGVEYQFTVRAKSFLHNQVRSFVGTLERVGVGSWRPQDVKTALDARQRAACGPVCPPQGLYLAGVIYDPDPFSQD